MTMSDAKAALDDGLAVDDRDPPFPHAGPYGWREYRRALFEAGTLAIPEPGTKG